VKVGDLVDVNQERGTGSYKHTTPRGLGVILRLEETEPLMFDKIGPIDLGPLVNVLLNTGEIEGFSPKSMEVISESR
tara:strand:+ start:226 stop:456 length:231 start_codon:yes stop_codon:yes gene_type:complete